MEFKEVLVTEDNSTYSVKKEVTTKVVIQTKDGFVDNNRNLCVVEDTGNGYIAHFPSFTSTQQDHYVCLDYAQAEYLMQAVAELLGKGVTSKEVQVKPSQEDRSIWFRHDGTGQPVSDGTEVDVKFRNGNVQEDHAAETWRWNHHGEEDDIVAWRYSK